MTRDDAKALVKKHGSRAAAARAAGMSPRTFDRRLAGIVVTHPEKAKHSSQPPLGPKVGRSLADFRAAHDKNFIVPAKIKAALKALGDGWEYEAQFIRLAGVSQSDMGNFREQFSEYIVIVDRTKRVWAGSKATAARLRDMVN